MTTHNEKKHFFDHKKSTALLKRTQQQPQPPTLPTTATSTVTATYPEYSLSLNRHTTNSVHFSYSPFDLSNQYSQFQQIIRPTGPIGIEMPRLMFIANQLPSAHFMPMGGLSVVPAKSERFSRLSFNYFWNRNFKIF